MPLERGLTEMSGFIGESTAEQGNRLARKGWQLKEIFGAGRLRHVACSMVAPEAES